MHTAWDSWLKPVWKALAHPGLGNPHTPYENELMVKGIKPTALINKCDITAQLEQAISSGNVVIIDTHVFSREAKIYCNKAELETARKLSGFFDRKEFKTCHNDTKSLEFFRSAQSNRTVEGIESGKTKGVLHFRDPCLAPAYPNEFENAVANQKIHAVTFTAASTIVILAQSKERDKGEELNARSYKQNEGYAPLEGNEWSKRIGELLGFTPNDIAWHTGEKYQNPIILKAMTMTEDIRKKARIKMMFMDAPRAP